MLPLPHPAHGAVHLNYAVFVVDNRSNFLVSLRLEHVEVYFRDETVWVGFLHDDAQRCYLLPYQPLAF